LLLVISMLWSLLASHQDPFAEAIRKRGYPASLVELDAWYLAVPAAQNPALVYTNALAMLTNGDGPITNFTGKSWLPPLGQGLSTTEKSELKALLDENQAALRLLYSAPASSHCRYPLHLEAGLMTLLPHLGKMKQAVSLLTAEGLLHATEGDAEKATQAFLAAGRLSDSLAEEPITISLLVRDALWGILLPRLERALSLTTFTAAQLAALQQMAEQAERPRHYLRAMVGEQADGLSVFTDHKVAEDVLGGFRVPPNQDNHLQVTGLLTLLRITGLLERDKAFYCDAIGKQLAAAELPYPARFAADQQLAAITNTPGRFYIFSRMLLPSLPKLYLRDAEQTALARVTAAALAIERYRLAHANALPDNLEQLTPTYCKPVPTDPYDGKPLRYKKHGPSYAVYSLGSNGSDDGGVDWEAVYFKVPQDISFVVKH
jgi:hypothetical protein